MRSANSGVSASHHCPFGGPAPRNSGSLAAELFQKGQPARRMQQVVKRQMRNRRAYDRFQAKAGIVHSEIIIQSVPNDGIGTYQGDLLRHYTHIDRVTP